MIFDFAFMKDFTNNIGSLIGPNCEIVIHDLTKGVEHTIVHIVNGQVSGREIGGCPTNLFFETVGTSANEKQEYSEYYTKLDDGRVIRSSTTMLHDEDGELIGAICINWDVTELLLAKNSLNQLIGKASIDSSNESERFVRNVQELMEHYLSEVEREIGKPAAEMNRQEKMRALAYLDERGIFQIAKAHVHLCKFFDISKFTLYNYLDEVRKANSTQD